MSLNRKKSRPITVNDEKYRFIVSTTKIDENFNFSLNLTIQHEIANGSALKVKGLITRDTWLDFSDSNQEFTKDDYPIILPRHISKIIEFALKKGWKPQERGSEFKIETNNELFFD